MVQGATLSTLHALRPDDYCRRETLSSTDQTKNTSSPGSHNRDLKFKTNWRTEDQLKAHSVQGYGKNTYVSLSSLEFLSWKMARWNPLLVGIWVSLHCNDETFILIALIIEHSSQTPCPTAGLSTTDIPSQTPILISLVGEGRGLNENALVLTFWVPQRWTCHQPLVS